MNRLLTALAAALVLGICLVPAHAANYLPTTLRMAVVTSCAAALSPPLDINSPSGGFLTVDVNGNLCLGALSGGATTVTANQGTPALSSNAWPEYLTLAGTAVASGNPLPVLAMAGTNTMGKVAPGYTPVQTPASASSTISANASAIATLPGAIGKTTYIAGFKCTASGATAGSPVTLTVVGVTGGTLNYTFTAGTGATVASQEVGDQFVPPLPSSASNTAIVVTLPALGAGNTNATCNARGYQE